MHSRNLESKKWEDVAMSEIIILELAVIIGELFGIGFILGIMARTIAKQKGG